MNAYRPDAVVHRGGLLLLWSDPGGTQTLDLQNRNLTLYSTKLLSPISSEATPRQRTPRAVACAKIQILCTLPAVAIPLLTPWMEVRLYHNYRVGRRQRRGADSTPFGAVAPKSVLLYTYFIIGTCVRSHPAPALFSHPQAPVSPPIWLSDSSSSMLMP